jgi:hypothetical protein
VRASSDIALEVRLEREARARRRLEKRAPTPAAEPERRRRDDLMGWER